LDWTSCFLCGH